MSDLYTFFQTEKYTHFTKETPYAFAGHSSIGVGGIAATVFIAARQGDETAKKVIEQFVGYLSEGIADFVNILRPEAIVLGGGIANEGEALFAPLREAVDKRSYIAMDIVPLKIVGAQLGNKAGVYGAYCLATENDL